MLSSTFGPAIIGTPAVFPVGSAQIIGVGLGINATGGWQGCAHKIGFTSVAAAGGAFGLNIELGGSSQSTSQIPATLAELGADTIELNVLVRSALGTRYQSRITPTQYQYGG